jgi:hypothetical protein
LSVLCVRVWVDLCFGDSSRLTVLRCVLALRLLWQ